jgi:hypothetical protein
VSLHMPYAKTMFKTRSWERRQQKPFLRPIMHSPTLELTRMTPLEYRQVQPCQLRQMSELMCLVVKHEENIVSDMWTPIKYRTWHVPSAW